MFDARKNRGFTTETQRDVAATKLARRPISPAATQSGFSRLTVTHELEGAPIMAEMVASRFSEMGTGGWSWILSDLKSLLETGKPMGG